jgi:hypothetical protein
MYNQAKDYIYVSKELKDYIYASKELKGCICVLEVSIFSLSTMLLLDFVTFLIIGVNLFLITSRIEYPLHWHAYE